MTNENPGLTCKLCGRLVTPGQVHCACGAKLASAPSASANREPRLNLSPVLAAMPMVGAIAFAWYLWGSGAGAAAAPVLKILLIVFIACAALAMLEVSRLTEEQEAIHPEEEPPWHPVAWFAFMLLVWPVAFPVYAWKMLRPANRNLFVTGAVSWVLFLAGFAMLQSRANPNSPDSGKALTLQSTPAVATPSSSASVTTGTSTVAAVPSPVPVTPAPSPVAATPYVNPPAYIMQARKAGKELPQVTGARVVPARTPSASKSRPKEENTMGVAILKKRGQ